MSKRRNELIDSIFKRLLEIEKFLIETPAEVTNEAYDELIQDAKRLREALEILKNM